MDHSRKICVVTGSRADYGLLEWPIKLLKADRFFDVLPRGVSKGPSLRRLIAHLGTPDDRVLVAGDTLNDLSMLECGLNAVAVGGSEPALVERLRDRPAVHLADGVGAAGILVAAEHFGFRQKQ